MLGGIDEWREGGRGIDKFAELVVVTDTLVVKKKRGNESWMPQMLKFHRCGR